jgi:hypothetical protein
VVKRKFLTLPGLELRPPRSSSPQPVAIPTALSWLFFFLSYHSLLKTFCGEMLVSIIRCVEALVCSCSIGSLRTNKVTCPRYWMRQHGNLYLLPSPHHGWLLSIWRIQAAVEDTELLFILRSYQHCAKKRYDRLASCVPGWKNTEVGACVATENFCNLHCTLHCLLFI